MMLVVSSLLVIVAFGWVVTLVVVPDLRFLERLALAYGLGLGLMTLLMFCLDLVGLSLSLATMLAPLVMLTAIMGGMRMSTRGMKAGRIDAWNIKFGRLLPHLVERFKSLSTLEKMLVFMISLLLLSHLLITSYWPVYAWDALTVYDLRARLIVDKGSIQEGLMTKKQFSEHGLGLPPFTSLAHTWIYLWGIDNPKFLYSLLFASFLIIFYYSLRQHCNVLCSLTFTLLLASSPVIFAGASTAYTNFPFAFYFAGGVLYLYRWMYRRIQGGLTLAGLFVGLSSWVRAESHAFFLAIFLILTVYCLLRKKYFAPLWFGLLCLPIEPLWRRYVIHVLGSEPSGGFGGVRAAAKILSSQPVDWTRLAAVLDFLREAFRGHYTIVLLLFAVAVLLHLKNLKEHGYLFLLVISNIGLFIAGSYVFSIAHSNWRGIPDSANRLFMFILPLALCYAALTKPVRDLFIWLEGFLSPCRAGDQWNVVQRNDKTNSL